MTIEKTPNGKSNSNGAAEGKITLLLWANTVLTALLLPLLVFVGNRIWAQVDTTTQSLSDLRVHTQVLSERYSFLLSEIGKLHTEDERLRQDLSTHKNQTDPIRKP